MNAEDRYCRDTDLSCACCGGSGHKGDVWQPIETAPKDGREILLAGRATRPSIDAGKAVIAKAYWTEHNGGGWVWHGCTTHFTKWANLPDLPDMI